MKSRTIRGRSDIDEGVQHLCKVEVRFEEAAALAGEIPLRLSEGGFKNLLDIIVSQQLSVASADAIWSRLETAGLTEQPAVAGCEVADLMACGLSKQKSEYALGLAASKLDYAGLVELDDQMVVDRLVQVRGIGPWTAEIYCMFALGRADVLAAGDLALQEAARILFGLEVRPSTKALREMAQPWSPWRAVAARLLWAYYRAVVRREGVR